MLILILVFGVFPNLLFRIFDPPVTDLVARLTEALGTMIARSPRPGLLEWVTPVIDWHAIAPELVLIVGINVVLASDLLVDESRKWATASLTGFVLLGATIPVVTLAVIGDGPRSLFDGRYVVDDFALILKALFLLTGYVVVLLSQNELEEGGYYQGEYYVLLLCSVLGMVMMSSSRDLVSVFIALELLSIPAYMLAAWRKRDGRSNEAGVKYYLLGVFASGVLLYGMSLLYGATGTTRLVDIGAALADQDVVALEVIAVAFVVAGFGFKVSAVPFHTWAPDTYEGAPLPGHRVPVGGVEGGRLRRPDPRHLPRLPDRRRRLRAARVGAVGADDDRRQRHRPAPDEHRAHARLLQRQPGRVHPHAAGVRRHRRRRRGGDEGRRRLPPRLRLHQPRRLRRRDRRRPHDAQRADLVVRRADQLRPGTGRVADDLPRQPRRRAAARRLDRQVQRVPRRPRCRHDGGVRARRDRRRQHRHRRRLLPAGDAHDVDGPAARGRADDDRDAAAR